MDDERLKEAARGYLYLKMPQAALEELSFLSSQDEVDTLDLFLATYMMAEDWPQGVEYSQKLCKLRPRNSRYFIHAAYCLHELGKTIEAKDVLKSGPTSLLKDPLYHYNMACYLNILGNSSEATKFLVKAISMDESLRSTAGSDSDLNGIVITE